MLASFLARSKAGSQILTSEVRACFHFADEGITVEGFVLGPRTVGAQMWT